jgi:hypothetical protein
MAVFAVIGSMNPAAIKQAIVRQYGANHYEFTPSTWFVPDAGTSKDVADKLGITRGENGVQGAVIRFDGYSGLAAAAAWTWIAANPGTIPNG